MANSQILQVYDRFKASEILVQGAKVRVFNLQELPDQVTSAVLPCRLLLPLGAIPVEGRDSAFINIGNTLGVDWNITDLFLYKSTQAGIGLREFGPLLVEYAGKYLDMVRGIKNPTTQTTLTNISVNPQVYEFPAGSGGYYAGVLCQLTVREIIYG